MRGINAMTEMSPGLSQALSRAANLASRYDAGNRAISARSYATVEAIDTKRAAQNDFDYAIRQHARHQTKMPDSERARYQARIAHATETVTLLQNQDGGVTAAAGEASGRCARFISGLGEAKPTIVDERGSTNLPADQAKMSDIGKAIERYNMRSVVPPAEGHATLDKNFDRMVAAGEPSVTAEGRIRLPHHVPSGQVDGVPDVASILIWLGGDSIRAHLHAKLDELYKGIDPSLVMTAKEKQAKLHALRGQHLDLQRKIAAAAWRLIEAGDDKAVLWLRDCEAPAILGITV